MKNFCVQGSGKFWLDTIPDATDDIRKSQFQVTHKVHGKNNGSHTITKRSVKSQGLIPKTKKISRALLHYHFNVKY